MAIKQPTVDTKLNDFMSAADDEFNEKNDSPQEEEYTPQYRVISEEKIPVTKTYGKIWKSRRDAAISKLENDGDIERWNTAIEYYRADHSGRRDTADIATDKDMGMRLTTKGVGSENIVFANTTALVPSTYAKNPRVEITCEGRTDLQPFADVLERLINVLIGKKASPGVNLKPKARKGVVMATLTNYAYIESGYTKRQESSENSLEELNDIAKKLEKEKDKKKIMELEARLIALEDKVDLLRPEGPWTKYRKPFDVLIDPDANSLDEARWVMIREYISSDFLKVVYGKPNDDGTYDSIYEPTHILKVNGNNGTNPTDEDLTSFSLFDTSGEKSAKDYGYKDDESFKRAQVTECWYVWDKATRRVYLYNSNDWKWPVWVWSDPYKYDTFFPISELEFYVDPCEYHARGEVSYYLDMQDGINEINNEIAKVRAYIVGKVLYNKTLLGDKGEEILDAFISGTNRKRALGVDLPPDVDLTKLFLPMVPQSAHMLNTTVFDKERLIQAVDRVSSVTNVQRGVEYKTNTTNRAIESYESNTQTRLDEKIDAIEEWIGDIGWKLAQVCMQNMSSDMIGKILGEDAKNTWEQDKPTIDDLQSYFTVTCVGGSSLKPTSVVKKQQAAQLGQILGQFARATPVALLVALKVMEQAYDEIIIRKEDWEMIKASIAQQLQAGGGAQQNDSNDRAGDSKGAPQEQEDGPGQLEQLEAMLDSLPVELKQELARMIAGDMPIKQAIATVVQEMQAMMQTPDMGANNVGAA